MSEAKEKIQNFTENLTQFVTLESPQSYKNLTIIPLILKDDLLDFITIKEAEAAELGYIQEMQSETVATLQAVNKATKPMLIPYMQVVKGGKQDRTIFEPILVAAGGTTGLTLNVPSQCIERSRWTYRSAPESMSKQFKTSSQKMTIGIQAEAMRAPYRHQYSQSTVWNTIESMSAQMGLGAGAAPTRSGIQMQETQKSKIDEYASHFKTLKNQSGVIVLVNNQVVAIELYGNPTALTIFWEDLLNSFAMEATLRSDGAKDLKPLKATEVHDRALRCFEKLTMQYNERPGVGLGTIVEFADQNLVWAGITLIYDNKFAHLYIVGQSVFPEEKVQTQQLRVSQLRRQMRPLE